MPRLCCGSIRAVACLHIYTDHVSHVYSLHSRIQKPFQTTCMTSEHNLQQNPHRKGNESLQYVVTLGPKVDLSLSRVACCIREAALQQHKACPAASCQELNLYGFVTQNCLLLENFCSVFPSMYLSIQPASRVMCTLLLRGHIMSHHVILAQRIHAPEASVGLQCVYSCLLGSAVILHCSTYLSYLLPPALQT